MLLSISNEVEKFLKYKRRIIIKITENITFTRLYSCCFSTSAIYQKSWETRSFAALPTEPSSCRNFRTVNAASDNSRRLVRQIREQRFATDANFPTVSSCQITDNIGIVIQSLYHHFSTYSNRNFAQEIEKIPIK